MKVLLAVDGSKNSSIAVRSLTKHLPWLRDTPKIDLIYVQLPLRPIGSLLGTPLSQETIDQYYREQTAEHLAEAKRILHEAKLAFETHLIIGDPAQEIRKFAESHKSDVILIGSRGMGAIGNLLLGSTAAKILHTSTIPVVVIPPESPH